MAAAAATPKGRNLDLAPKPGSAGEPGKLGDTHRQCQDSGAKGRPDLFGLALGNFWAAGSSCPRITARDPRAPGCQAIGSLPPPEYLDLREAPAP